MKSKLLLILVLGFALSLFFLQGIFLLDSDFGWHLQMGNFILHHGIPKTDPFSYTMPSYPFVDHEWLTNVLIAFLYPKIGMAGLAAVFSFVAIASMAIATNCIKTLEEKILFLLGCSICVLFGGVRPQVITWIFFSLLLYVFFHSGVWKKFRFCIPFLFFIWVNLHGGFAIGIVALFVGLLTRFFVNKRANINDVFVFVFSLCATFMNPYGYRIWWEVWMQMSDSSLHWTISEWIPTIFSSISISLFLFISLSLATIFIYRKKVPKEELLLYIGLFIASQSSVRHIPLWVIIALPLLLQCHGYIREHVRTFQYGLKKLAVCERYCGVFLILVIGLQTILFWQALHGSKQNLAYPESAVVYLSSHTISGNIFSTYNWGGYLLWKIPEKRVFIDGRMPSWRWKVTDTKESGYAFQDYQNIEKGKLSLATVVKKYHITVFLLPIYVTITPKARSKNTWMTVLYSLNTRIFGKSDHIQRDLPKELEKLGFRNVFSDNTAIILSLYPISFPH